METSVLTTVLLPVALAFIMITLGLSLTPGDFRRIFTQPKGVSIGLANLLLISPLLAFLVAELWGLGPELAVGLVLLGASPGGTLANLLTHLARGDTALSVSMTALSSLCAIVTIPLFLTLAVDRFDAPGLDLDVDTLGIVARVFFITLVPLAIGMFVRARAPDWVERNEPTAKRIAMVVFIAVVVAAVIDEREKVVDNFADVAGAALTLNLAAMSISYAIARLSRLSGPQATAIAMELGVHNTTVSITIGAAISTAVAIPGAVYAAFMFITAGLFARFMARRNARESGMLTGPDLEKKPA